MNHSDSKETSPSGAKRQRRKPSRTRLALRSALLELLEEGSFEQFTVKEITARANVGYATFFRQYTDREELLHDLAADEIRRMLTMALPVLYSVDSLASNQALCSYVWEHRKLWRALLTGGAASALKEEYLKQALDVAMEGPDPRAWLPGDLAVTFSVTVLLEVLAWWLKHSDPPSIKKMAKIINHLAVVPIYSPEREMEGQNFAAMKA